MRSVLRFAATRYGLAGLLALAVLAIVGVSRLFGAGNNDEEPDFAGAPPTPPGASVSVEPDDGISDEDVAADNATELPGDAPDPLPVAVNFATAWLDHEGVGPEEWLAALEPYATAGLTAQLTGVDPVGVPATRITGEAEITQAAGGAPETEGSGTGNDTTAPAPEHRAWAEVMIPLDNGLLHLGLVLPEGGWLVDRVDWERT